MTQAVLIDRPQQHPRMTFEEFLDYGEEGQRFEWVSGEVFEMPSPSVLHQFLAGFLFAILRFYVRRKQLGTVLQELTMRLPQRPSGRDPDILFVSNAQSHRLRANYLEGAADLIVEIISPGTEDQDPEEKLIEYQQAGVLEYWLIDGVRQTAEFYQLDADGYFQSVLPDSDSIYRSVAISGLWLKAEWLWQSNPDEFTIYQEWELI